MMRLASTAVLLLFAAGSASAQGVAQGKQVFTDSKCSVCHSIGGQGNKKGPLDDVGSKLSAADIRQWITSAPEMAVKAKADLPKADVDALVAYMQTLKKK